MVRSSHMDILELLFWASALVVAHLALRRASFKLRRASFVAYGVIQAGFELHAIVARTELSSQAAPMLALAVIAVAIGLTRRAAPSSK